jgi:hypothetical protein
MVQNVVVQLRCMLKDFVWFFICVILVLRYMLDCFGSTLNCLMTEKSGCYWVGLLAGFLRRSVY